MTEITSTQLITCGATRQNAGQNVLSHAITCYRLQNTHARICANERQYINERVGEIVGENGEREEE